MLSNLPRPGAKILSGTESVKYRFGGMFVLVLGRFWSETTQKHTPKPKKDTTSVRMNSLCRGAPPTEGLNCVAPPAVLGSGGSWALLPAGSSAPLLVGLGRLCLAALGRLSLLDLGCLCLVPLRRLCLVALGSLPGGSWLPLVSCPGGSSPCPLWTLSNWGSVVLGFEGMFAFP